MKATLAIRIRLAKLLRFWVYQGLRAWTSLRFDAKTPNSPHLFKILYPPLADVTSYAVHSVHSSHD